MKMLLVIFLLFPSIAFAYDGRPDFRSTGFYTSILGRLTLPESSDINGNLESFPELSDSTLSLEGGLNGSMAFGWRFRNGWRGEIEYSRLSHDSGRLESSLAGSEHFTINKSSESDQESSADVMQVFCGGKLGPAKGHKATCGGRLGGREIEKHQADRISFDTSGILKNRKYDFLMVNTVRDFYSGNWVVPYAGFGLGVGMEEEAEALGFAYQFLVGMSLKVFDPVELIVGYRYMGITKLDYKYEGGGYSSSATFNNVDFGIRYLF